MSRSRHRPRRARDRVPRGLRRLPDEPALRAEHAKLLGKKGDLTAVLGVACESRPRARPPAAGRAGERASRRSVESCVRGAPRRARARRARRRAQRARPSISRCPGASRSAAATRTPSTQVKRRAARDLPRSRLRHRRGPRGRARGEQLHEARVPAGSPGDGHAGQLLDQGPEDLLRTHTSNVQVREMIRRASPPWPWSAPAGLSPRRRRDALADVPPDRGLPGGRAA
jgi:hypothetical protein